MSIIHKFGNIYTNKGYLCLKVILVPLLNKTRNNNKSEEEINDNFWSDSENDDNVKKEEEINDNFLSDNENDDDVKEENDEEINNEAILTLYSEYQTLDNHPNIAKDYGFSLGDKTTSPCILLELCKTNLEKGFKHLNSSDLVAVAYEICSAMEFVHSKGIIHQNLKINNILLNSKKHVNICDFGLSKVLYKDT